MLQIKDLSVNVEEKEIIKDLNLEINNGEIHVLMGPNGVGKSTLCKVLLNDTNYSVTKGSIIYNSEDILKLSTSDIAKRGIYLINQNPISVEGITVAEMLRVALSEKKKETINVFEFSKKLEELCKKLNIPKSFVHREVNVGMSGGEKKKNEVLQLWVLEPNFIILDELDSGLDIDALKIVANSVFEYYQKFKPSILIITHHNKILEYIKPDYVHVLKDGKIIKSGDKSLAMEIEKNGFTDLKQDE